MADPRVHADGTVRIVTDRRLLRSWAIEPVVVEVHSLHAPWQAEAERNAAERIALTGNAVWHFPPAYRRSARWDRPDAPAAD